MKPSVFVVNFDQISYTILLFLLLTSNKQIPPWKLISSSALLLATGQKQPPQVFCKKGVLRNFAKFTGKQEQFFHKTPLDDCFYMFYSNRQVVLSKLLIIYFFPKHFLSTVVTRFNYLKLIICYIYVNIRSHALSFDFDYLTLS